MALHRHIFSLHSLNAVSENELSLTYLIDPPEHQPKQNPTKVTITLLFVPNTRQLADVQLQGSDINIGDVVGSHVQANDVPGLITALLARLRAGV